MPAKNRRYLWVFWARKKKLLVTPPWNTTPMKMEGFQSYLFIIYRKNVEISMLISMVMLLWHHVRFEWIVNPTHNSSEKQSKQNNQSVLPIEYQAEIFMRNEFMVLLPLIQICSQNWKSTKLKILEQAKQSESKQTQFFCFELNLIRSFLLIS